MAMIYKPLIRASVWASAVFALFYGLFLYLFGLPRPYPGGWQMHVFTAIFFFVLAWVPIFVAVAGWGYLWHLITRASGGPKPTEERRDQAPYG